MCFIYFFAPWLETFADAGDEDGGGGEPLRTILVQKIVFGIWTFQFFDKSENIFLNMFIYTENGTESHRNTQNINIYSPPNTQNTKM